MHTLPAVFAPLVQVSALEGIITQQVAVGLGFSMFLVDDSNPSVAKLPVFESSVPKEAAAPEAEEKGVCHSGSMISGFSGLS